MEHITETHISDSKKWDEIVRSFPNYDVFYLSSYIEAFKLHTNDEPFLISYEKEGDRAINVVFRRDISEDRYFTGKLEENKYFDLVTPYGYGGFWGIVKDKNSLIQEYDEYCAFSNYICEFVRFSLFSNYKEYFNGEIETRTHNVIRSLEMPIEEIWMNFKHKVRKNVKRGVNNKLQIIIDTKGEYLDEFLEIYYSTMDRTNSSNEFYFSKTFFETLNFMNNNIVYFHVLYKERIISSELIIYGTENCYSYLGGTDEEFFNVRPNDFLKYEVIKWAKNKGLKNFVLGGGHGSDDGIFLYKSSLAPDGIVDFYIGKKVFNKDRYNTLVKMRGEEIENSSFFPLYRG